MDNTPDKRDKVAVTCVSCGAQEEIENTAAELRNRRCQKCGNTMIVKCRPGTSSHMPE